MEVRFTLEEDAWRREVDEFIEAELPNSLKAGGDPYSDENFQATMLFRRKLGTKKWIAVGWPKEYGGLGASIIHQMVFAEDMVYYNAPLDLQAYHIGPAIIAHGSQHLKAKFLAGTANQSILWCQGFSEPNAGSDLANVQTAAVADGDDFLITGQKIWTSSAHRANWAHMLARTDPSAPKHLGITYIVVDMRSPGITVVPLVDMAGRHYFNQVFFERVRVPKTNVIGEVNHGWYVATTALDNERSGIRAVAGARRNLDDLLGVLRGRRGTATHQNELVRHRVADLAIMVETARMLSYRVGWMQQTGRRPSTEASVVKVFSTEVTQRIGRVSMEAAGLFGQVLSGGRTTVANGQFPFRYIAEISLTISGGSSEINRNIIATRGLGLPRV